MKRKSYRICALLVLLLSVLTLYGGGCDDGMVQFRPKLFVKVFGSGYVTSDPDGIDCGYFFRYRCNDYFDYGQVVTLTATPSAGYEFDRWGGDCSGVSEKTTVTMPTESEYKGGDHDLDCIATFTPLDVTTTTTVESTTTTSCNVLWDEVALYIEVIGSGTVTSNTGGINCPPICCETIGVDEVVTLTAAPDSGWKFYSWGGDCSGTSEKVISLIMNAEKNCSATFTPLDSTTTTVESTTTTTCTKVSLGDDDGTAENTFTNGPTDCVLAYVAKSFTLPDSCGLSEIKLWLTSTGDGGDYRFTVWTDPTGGSPDDANIVWQSDVQTARPPVWPDGDWFTVPLNGVLPSVDLDSWVIGVELLSDNMNTLSFTWVGMDDSTGTDANSWGYCKNQTGWKSLEGWGVDDYTLMIRVTACCPE